MSTIFIEADTLPEAWEEATLACWEKGARVRTQYDKPDDPPSRDCAALIVARRPFDEPRIHKAFPGSYGDLWKYRREVVDGVHDHWIDPAAGKWSYTYHHRICRYPLRDGSTRDQLDRVAQQLLEAPHTRRAQVITWIVDSDQDDEHPPCVQRLWFRVVDGALDMHLHIRSNDAWRAGFMNMFALTELQAELAGRLGVAVGTYRHFADSWHIYGSCFSDFEGFIRSVAMRPYCDRVIRTDDPGVREAFESAEQELAAERIQNAEAPHAEP